MHMIAALALLVASGVSTARAAEVRFQVRDRLASDEIEELTSLYIDGQFIRSFRLGDEERDLTVSVSVQGAGAHDYGLCGHLKLRTADGGVREQVVDVTGTILDADGRSFEAVATDDFKRFFLVDTTMDRPPTMITPRRDHACVPAIS